MDRLEQMEIRLKKNKAFYAERKKRREEDRKRKERLESVLEVKENQNKESEKEKEILKMMERGEPILIGERCIGTKNWIQKYNLYIVLKMYSLGFRQKQIAAFFKRDRGVISLHVTNFNIKKGSPVPDLQLRVTPKIERPKEQIRKKPPKPLKYEHILSPKMNEGKSYRAYLKDIKEKEWRLLIT